MRIYLVRHTESLPRDGMNYETGSRVGLSFFGFVQAKILGKFLRSKGIEKIYASPFLRTKKTAEIISNGILPIVFNDKIIEYAPSFSGVGKDFKEAKAKRLTDHDYKDSDGESFNDCAGRLFEFLNNLILNESNLNNICVVSHALVIEAFFHRYFGLQLPMNIKDVSVSLIEGNGGKLSYVFFNEAPKSAILLGIKLLKKLGL